MQEAPCKHTYDLTVVTQNDFITHYTVEAYSESQARYLLRHNEIGFSKVNRIVDCSIIK